MVRRRAHQPAANTIGDDNSASCAEANEVRDAGRTGFAMRADRRDQMK